ncbi:hypothetical protein DYY67_1151 [Candidatus Nitrosotalea sp. TS]|nr:hypothetical protein [Candidatus Nitrosotalea sp. TS]
MIESCKKMSKSCLDKKFKFDNKKNLSQSIAIIKNNLGRMAHA